LYRMKVQTTVTRIAMLSAPQEKNPQSTKDEQEKHA
jgi:hypothetical protein